MTCELDFLAEPIEHQLAFVHAWNAEAVRRHLERGEQYAGKDASERKSLGLSPTPNRNRAPENRA